MIGLEEGTTKRLLIDVRVLYMYRTTRVEEEAVMHFIRSL
jgi:hypothetical protein